MPERIIEHNCAAVAVEKAAYGFDKLYSYRVPEELFCEPLKGRRVLVSFGGGGKRRQGVIFDTSYAEDVSALRPLGELIDDEPVLSQELLELAAWLKETCWCTLFEAARALLPVGLGISLRLGYSIAEGIDAQALDKLRLSEAGRKIAAKLLELGISVSAQELLKSCGLPEDIKLVDALVKKGVATRSEETVRKAGDAKLRMVRLTKLSELPQKLSEKQRAIIELLQMCGGATPKELCELAGCGQSVLTGLKKRELVEYYEKEILRKPKGFVRGEPERYEIELTDEQEKAFQGLYRQYKSGRFGVNLLYGVTGSGKTLVFLKLIDKVLGEGKNVVVMVPEIALTPQTLERFRGRYGEGVAVIHSGLSLGERLDEWKRIMRGEANVVVGTRSAVFAPLDNIGLIIMDEEQEYTYKSEASPRYHARDVARFRCAWHKAQLLLCSATPSVESYCYALQGRYHLETLEKRYGDACLPQVSVIDVSEQKLSKNVISPQLREALGFNLEQGFQSILLHNRRGFHTFVSCRSCGRVVCCEQCSVSMTYHHDINRLVCHYCGATKPFTLKCPWCGEEQLRYAGQGTQKVEEELDALFPEARVLRMDADTTSGKYAHAEKLAAFASGQYDIMIGTQMVAKGLDFQRVTLVGVLLADQMLYSDDFRSYERAFSMLTQVVGRAGRGSFSGRAIIQTTTPDNPVIAMAGRQDYAAFYGSEINVRKAMLYPPYSDICVLGFVSESDEAAMALSEYAYSRLTRALESDYAGLPVRILGPSPAGIHRLGGKYRYRMILKCKNSKLLRELLSSLLSDPELSKKYKFAQMFIDMNPDSVI